METITEQFERQIWLSATTVSKMFDIHRRSLARWFANPKLGFPQPTTIRGEAIFLESRDRSLGYAPEARIGGAVHPKGGAPRFRRLITSRADARC
jgi:hypothetical protein